MKMVFKFLFAAGFVFAQVTLFAVTAYSAWTVCLADESQRFQLSRDGFRNTRKIDDPNL